MGRQVSGLVEAVSKKNNSLKVQGEWYRLSSRTKGKLPRKGEKVRLVVNGDWVDEIIKSGNRNGENGTNGTRMTIHARSRYESKLIARQTALKAATDLAISGINSGKLQLDQQLKFAIIGAAQVFYDWLVNGKKQNGDVDTEDTEETEDNETEDTEETEDNEDEDEIEE